MPDNDLKQKKLYIKLILISVIISIIGIFIIINELGPKPNYESFFNDLSHLIEEVDNLKGAEMTTDGIISVYIDDTSWKLSSDLDKATYCRRINELITIYCHNNNIIKDNRYALVYYYNQDGINLAKPKTLSLESDILY